MAETGSDRGLLPQLRPSQAVLVDSILHDNAAPYHQLIGRPGSGRSAVATAVVAALATRISNARILVLVPSPLKDLFRYAIEQKELSCPVEAVDRFRFRELQATAPDYRSPWPMPFIAILGLDQLRVADIASSIEAVDWNLVVVDEGDRLSGKAAEVIQRLIRTGRAKRLLALSSVPSSLPGGVSAVTVNLSHEADHRSGPREIRHETISFIRSRTETVFLNRLDALLDQLGSGEAERRYQSLVRDRAESSTYACEQSLYRIRNALAHAQRQVEELDDESGLSMNAGDKNAATVMWANPGRVFEIVTQLLSFVDLVESDSKLEALTGLLQRVRSYSSPPSVVIFSGYADTVTYVHSALLDRGVRARRIFSGIPISDRTVEIQAFLNDGGVLVTTDAAVRGLELPGAHDVVHYDIPRSPEGLYIRLVRVGRPKSYLLQASPGRADVSQH